MCRMEGSRTSASAALLCHPEQQASRGTPGAVASRLNGSNKRYLDATISMESQERFHQSNVIDARGPSLRFQLARDVSGDVVPLLFDLSSINQANLTERLFRCVRDDGSETWQKQQGNHAQLFPIARSHPLHGRERSSVSTVASTVSSPAVGKLPTRPGKARVDRSRKRRSRWNMLSVR